MKKLILIMICMMLVPVITAVTDYNNCYQESANVSNQASNDGDCNLNYSGLYDYSGTINTINNVYDGDYGTSGSYVGDSYLYINYTKPNNSSLVSAMWTIKNGDDYTNNTLPTNCFNAYDDKIVLYIRRYPNNWQYDCHNTTDWVQIRDVAATASTLFEEGIYWNISSERNIFSYCNASINTVFLNYTFKDEINDTFINATLQSLLSYYWTQSFPAIKSLTYSNTTDQASHGFCFSPSYDVLYNNISLTSSKSGYPLRTFFTNYNLTNVTTNQTIYLLTSDKGLYVTFQIINQAEQTIKGAIVKANKTITVITREVQSGITGDDGGVTFFLDPDSSHTICVEATGYTTECSTITPTQSSYTIQLGSTTSTTDKDYTKGITQSIYPQDQTINNNTNYSFNYTVSSTFYSITEFGFTLVNDTGSVIGSSSASTNGGVVNVNVNTGNAQRLNMNYYYIIEGNYTNATKVFIIVDDSDYGYGIKTFFDDLKSYTTQGIFGIDNFGLSLITFVMIFLITGFASYNYGLTSKEALYALLFSLVLFFDIGIDLIPDIVARGGIEIPITTISVAIILIYSLILEVSR